MRILIVEDDSLVAATIVAAVNSVGHSVAGCAASVAEGLRLISECELDVAILDVNLLGENSAPVAAELIRQGIPFLVVTGSPLHQLAIEHQSAPIVKKPFGIAGFLNAVANLHGLASA